MTMNFLLFTIFQESHRVFLNSERGSTTISLVFSYKLTSRASEKIAEKRFSIWKILRVIFGSFRVILQTTGAFAIPVWIEEYVINTFLWKYLSVQFYHHVHVVKIQAHYTFTTKKVEIFFNISFVYSISWPVQYLERNMKDVIYI